LKTLVALATLVPLQAALIINTQTTACVKDGSGQTCSAAPSGSLNAHSGSLTFQQAATATSGIMHISAAGAFSVNNSQAWSLGFVSFNEGMLINSATKNGQTGKLKIGYHIDGTVSDSGQATAFLQVVARVYAPSLQNYVKDYQASTDGTFLIPQNFTFTYGQPFQLYLSMQAMVGTANIVPGTGGYNIVNRTGAGSGAVNFFNTLRVNELSTYDANDVPVGDSLFISDSGTAYSQAGVADVPEPGSLALLAIGALALSLRRR
jgi:hypothetical protein